MATAVMLAALSGAGIATQKAGPRFYPDDPVWVDDDRVADAAKADRFELDNYYDFLENSFGNPGDRTKIHAVNANTLDEVPDSSWFVNRIGRREMPVAEMVKGPDVDIKFGDAWTITRGKNRGFQPGFRAFDRSDPNKTVLQLEFDPPRNPELATAAETVGTAFYHAFGYHVVDVYILEIDPAKLEISPDATIRDSNGRRPFVGADLDDVMKNSAKLPNGRVRAIASRFVEGVDVGKFEYHGTRADDPNDIYPHEHRRELRGSRVFAAWLNHDDSRAVNSLVMKLEIGGKRHLKYYMFDFGSIFGSATRFADPLQSGREYLIRKGPALLTLATFGLYVRPWLRTDYPPGPASVGRFTADRFDPAAWVAEYPKAAYENMRPDDAFWGARIVSKFSDAAIRALVEKGRYSDPRAVDVLTDTLIKRRERIKEVWLTGINPIVNASLTATGMLTFENAAMAAGVGGAPESYSFTWSRFDNATDTHTRVGQEPSQAEPRAQAPADLLRGSDYISVTIGTTHQKYPQWKPVQVYFRRAASGWETVGLDRGLD